MKCTDLPLLLPSNTDSISSSYDPSNYYPQKPSVTNLAQKPIVKQDWSISESSTQPCWLAPANGVFGDYAKIRAIIFLDSDKKSTQKPTIEALSSAQTLANLWANSISKKSTTAEALPQWLTGIQGYTITSVDLKQAKSMINNVSALID